MGKINFKLEKESFGHHVRKLRKKIESKEYNRTEISLQELTDNFPGITKKTLGLIERGETNPKFETLLVLAEMFKITLPELLDYKKLK